MENNYDDMQKKYEELLRVRLCIVNETEKLFYNYKNHSRMINKFLRLTLKIILAISAGLLCAKTLMGVSSITWFTVFSPIIPYIVSYVVSHGLCIFVKEKERLKLDKEYTNISNQIDKLKSEINIKSKTKNNIDVEKNNKNHIEISNNKKVEDALNNYIEHLEGQNSKEELKNKTLNKTLVQ